MGTRAAPVDYIERTRELYASLGYGSYRWATNTGTPPWTRLRKPLAASRVALVASGGVYLRGQVAFHFHDDTSFRIIAADTPSSELRLTHFAYDLTDARSDPSVVFPLETLRDFASDGTIAALGPNAYSLMGGIYSARKVSELLAPAISERLLRDEVDVALFVPV
jgi:D-proline reductase (dithiol) PrdB